MDKIYTLLLCVAAHISSAQVYTDHFGLGQTIGVTISSSDENDQNLSIHTLSGNEHPVDENGASRFLSQATMGANHDEILELNAIGIDQWLNLQFALPVKSFAAKYDSIYNEVITIITDLDPNDRYLSFTFYEMLMKYPDVLRQKVAFALSQIFVISPAFNGDISDRGFAVSSYYDILYQNAFGNYKDILYEVSMHPVMGIYLSHFQNDKADIIQGVLPDENFAREIMQLFSIGLFELNNDGTLQLDANGDFIPTYTIAEVAELSKVFTGFSGSPINSENGNDFDESLRSYNLTEPMVLFQEYHDKREKRLLGSTYIPPNLNGSEDLNIALDMLFDHPNVGPFIAIRLIQQLVKSNPSPAYVNRVASAFNNNGAGIRGDLQTVIRAILLDPEARDIAWMSHPQNGKLIQPIERFTKMFKAFHVTTPSGRIWLYDRIEYEVGLEQAFLSAPTVFNFYTPFFAEKNFIAPEDLVSPEFQILNSSTGINYLNLIENALERRPFRNYTLANINGNNLSRNENDEPRFDFTEERSIYNSSGLDALIDRLDLLLSRGQLSTATKNEIIHVVTEKLNNVNNYDFDDIIIDVVYFIMLSPDFVILK